MKKMYNGLLGCIVLAPLAYMAYLWNSIPEKVPLHYNISGEIDRYGKKIELVLVVGIMVLVSASIFFILRNIHRIDPKKKYTQENVKKMNDLAVIIPLFLSVLSIFIINQAHQGGRLFNGKYIFIGMGVLLAILGNYMYNIKPNYFVGFRIPTTLEDENNWKATHRLAAPLWFVGGVMLIFLSLLLPAKWVIYGLVVIVLLICIVPITYSIYLYRKIKND